MSALCLVISGIVARLRPKHQKLTTADNGCSSVASYNLHEEAIESSLMRETVIETFAVPKGL